MRRLRLLLLLLLPSGCAPPSAPTPASGGGYLEAIQAGNWAEAERLLSEEIQRRPSVPDLLANRGKVRSFLGRREGSYEDYVAAARLDPSASCQMDVHGGAYPLLRGGYGIFAAIAASSQAAHRLEAGDLDGAEAWAGKALAAAPGFGPAHWPRGRARLRKGNRDGAYQDLLAWMEFQPAYRPLLAEAGLLLFDDARRQAARGEALGSAWTCQVQGDPAGALSALRRAWALGDSDSRMDLALLGDLLRCWRRAGAGPELPEEARRFMVQAQSCAEGKQYLEAADACRKAYLLCPWHADAYFNRALFLAELGAQGPAVETMRLYVGLFPDLEDARKAQDRIYEWETRGKAVAEDVSWKPWAGFLLEEKDGAVRIQSVAADSPASSAGLKPGDRILRLGPAGKTPSTAAEVVGGVRAGKPGDLMPLVLLRDGKEVPVTIRLAHRSLGT